ncbi:hypothetical protein CMO89_00835 [Candidatus Woesearchaeota archaeon]|nr:hypothetical protein [Candidatus Woesearchaeota archaeon]|tara:strand:+ start:15893 stop:17683 length:1791 start_codon:yes stop_codon:yes gene_type:complete
MEMGIGNIIGLYGLLALIPLIVLYLRKPKPLDRVIPSLMFLISESKAKRKFTFFRNLVRNFLLLLQILTLSVLALSLTEPFADMPHNASVGDTVIILDESASSQTSYGASTRFERAISLARKYLDGRISIISTSNIPNTLLESGTKKDASAILNSMKPKDTPTNIEGAMIEAENLLKNKKGGNIYVISDFITTQEADQPLKAKRYLSALGYNVMFIDVSSNASNIGIVDLLVDKRETKVFIKNFNSQEADVPVRLIVEDKIIKEKSVKLLPNSVETAVFETQPSVSKIELDIDDDLNIDNHVFISTPPRKKIKVLLITNADETYLMSAIKASKDTEIEVRKPPIVKAFDLTHDIIVIDNVKEKIVPSDIRDIASYIRSGKSLIITAQQEIEKSDLAELYPVEFKGTGNATRVCTKIFNFFTKRFENKGGGCFTTMDKYFPSSSKNNTLVLVAADDDSPLITINDEGDGKIVYYGIMDEYSDFKAQEDYPIFWENLINFLMGSEDISDYNKRFDYKGLENYEKIGIYDAGDKKVAVNLLNEKESDVSIENSIKKGEKAFVLRSGEKSFNLSLVVPLLILTSLLLLVEIFYIKRRGDL